MNQGFNPPGVWQPFASFSLGMVQGEGRVVQLCGQISWDEDKRVVGKGNIALQTKQCIDNIKAVLSHVGGTLKDVSSLTLYVTDLTDIAGVHKVRSEYFGETCPVGTLVKVSQLIDPEMLIEITATAVIPHDRFVSPKTCSGGGNA
ncbi:MAG: 2-iminobutanoate/2-iminopropanoate deaminase [Gammaproteobacteria bacterium]|jgi:2-iminobutanoate/2-iminopropanoate deaminase